MKEYSSAPLPFMGQKRMFAKNFKKILKKYPNNATYVDLFGGSGLLSSITKFEKPEAKVIFNDYDNYNQRLQNIDNTNNLISDFRKIVGDYPRHKAIPEKMKQFILERIEAEESKGYVDYITISSSLLFSMSYRTSLSELRKETFWNNIRKSNYATCPDYLKGVDIVSLDYKDLFDQYKNIENVVYLVDPPYLSTEVGTYTMHWKLADYLGVLTILQGKRFVYFTSNKSQIIELCEWMQDHPDVGNPFMEAGQLKFNAHMNYSSRYTDIMIFK